MTFDRPHVCGHDHRSTGTGGQLPALAPGRGRSRPAPDCETSNGRIRNAGDSRSLSVGWVGERRLVIQRRTQWPRHAERDRISATPHHPAGSPCQVTDDLIREPPLSRNCLATSFAPRVSDVTELRAGSPINLPRRGVEVRLRVERVGDLLERSERPFRVPHQRDLIAGSRPPRIPSPSLHPRNNCSDAIATTAS